MQLLDKEDEEGVVEDNFEKFKVMYHPIWQSKFKDVIDISDGKVIIDSSPAGRRVLAQSVNDNVYKNIEKFSVLLFDEDKKFKKSALTDEEKTAVVDQLIEENDIKEQLDSGVDRILLYHRNTKLFLFMMTGPFLVILQTVKYILKYGTLYYLYRRGKAAIEEQKED